MLSPAVPQSGPSHIVAGTWLAKVERSGESFDVELHFVDNGVVFLMAGAHGVGSWHPTEDGIAYAIKEPLVDQDGVFFAYVDISQNGKVTADSLSSSGESKVYATNGTLMRTVAVGISAVPKR